MSSNSQSLVTREAAVAGQFYAGNPASLKKDLEAFFAANSGTAAGNPLALITPHAGYVYSGPVAAGSFRQIDRDSQFENIFIIGSSHRFSFDGAAIYTLGNFRTPLGEVPVNLNLGRELCENYSVFTASAESQVDEHSLEVQLPFLQYWLRKPFRIIPIVLGTENVSTCKKIADALRPYFNSSNLFVISTDFSHYPTYSDAQIADHRTAEAVLSNTPDNLTRAMQVNRKSEIPGLATSLCGWTSVMTLLYITRDMPGVNYKLIDYRNSGDASVGDKTRVVGYCAIGVFPSEHGSVGKNPYHLSESDRSSLLIMARESIKNYLASGKIPVMEAGKLSPAIKAPAGAFVSLYKNKELRGCLGRFDADQPLYQVVREMAVASSTRDTRFSPVKQDELDHLKIEISVLTPLKRISSPDEIILGKHGIYIKKGYHSGTYLPQVADGTGWTREEFLGHCSRDKAGIGWDGWKTAELYTYEAIVFGE